MHTCIYIYVYTHIYIYICIHKDLSIPRFRDSAKNRVIRFPPRNHEISVENREFRNFHGKSWIFVKFC